MEGGAQRPGLCTGCVFCVPVARLAVTFVYLLPNYKRSLELLKLNGHCFRPTCAKANVLRITFINFFAISFYRFQLSLIRVAFQASTRHYSTQYSICFCLP